jgi:hypothetical protein
MSLTDILVKLSKSGGDVLSRNLTARVANILDYLQELPEIRIFTANSQNFGHQSSTVNILRNLIRMGITTPEYTLVLYGKDMKDIVNLVLKIELLIPQFKAGDTSFTLNGVTVKVVEMTLSSEPLELGPLAITGGFDNLEEDKFPPYDQLNVVNYLQLQPYAWHRGTNMVRIDDGGLTDIINLDELSPATNLPRRAFYLDPKVTADDWEKMKSGPYAVQTNICEYLLEQLDASKIFLTAGYGYGTKGGGLTSLYNMLAGMRQSQITLAAAQKPTVLVAIGVDSADSSEISDADFGFADFNNPSEAFTAFLDNQVTGHIPSVGFGSTKATLEKVKTEVEKLEQDENKNQKVLIVFLDKVPGPLFDQLYKRASVPPLLEGQNTVELMLNLGKPYLKISSNETDAVFGYPTLPLSSLSSSAQALDAQGRAFNGIRASEPSTWFPDRATYPPTQLPPITKAYVTPQGSTLAKYFTRLAAFFHDELNDKLLRGLDLFVNVVTPGQFAGQVALVRTRGKAIATADENIVEALYLKLKEYADKHNGVVNLLQVITSGDVFEFFSGVVVDQIFRITDAVPVLSANKEVCTMTGKSLAFGTDAGLTDVDFKFVDANDSGKLGTTFNAKFSVKWALPGADWLSISNPEFGFKMSPVDKVPFVGVVGAHITAGLPADMKVTVPVEPDIFEFQVLFTEPRPGISNLFQMVGGINLQQYLPSQLQLLTDIEAASFTMRYNYALGSVDAMSATLETPPGKTWNLVPKVDVTSIQMVVTVISPGDRVARKTTFAITGEFAIVEATAYIAAYAPQLRVMGGLRENSKPLSVNAIVTTYLGPEFAAILPEAVAKAEISRLAFLVDQGAGRYSFGMTVQTVWKIPPSDTPVFTVTELGFDIEATSRAIDTPTGNEGRTIVLTGEEGTATGPSTTEITGSFTGNIVVDTSKNDKAQISVGAKYLGTDKGWTFSGKQTGGEVNLGYLISHYLYFPEPSPDNDYALDGLSVTAATGDGSWSFAAKTKDPWKIPFIPSFEFEANFSAGYNPPKKPFLLEGSTIVVPFGALAVANGCDGTGYYARIEVITRWNNIELLVWFDYCGSIKSFGITWEFLEALVTERENKQKQKEWIGILRFKKGTTLGEIVSKMVTWLTGSAFALESPWSVLNTISLNALSLEFNFSTNAVSFNVDIGPIELGFARIDSIAVTYNNNTEDPNAKTGVNVTLKGSFPWNIGEGANGDTSSLGPWDTSKPGTAPAPPGNGNKYLDLRLLALGQHVSATCLPTAKTVQAAIDCLASLPNTKPGEIPKINFDAESSWLIGTEFGVLAFGEDKKPSQLALVPRTGSGLAKPPEPKSGYLLTLQIVFNDPSLYGLRIALAGPAAKIFKGLDFQIMYRQISDSVGVYQAEITLPDVMRYLSVGAYSLTLPVFGISLYTNGDFQVDVGFPWNEDFSRSFTIEGIVYPGIPLIGSAGFYFGKLSSATSNQVPVVTNGTFNPVIVFGFGLQIGVGKSIRYGILSAGFSITVFGIIEGVIAKWNPYQLTNGGVSDNSQLQGAYYFWLRGTVGIIGKVFGTVDFAIIKADVNIEIKLMLQLTYESYVSIAITVLASVSVSVSISINLGFFSITISFSFSMRLKETFTIENKGTPPWKLAGPPPTLLRAKANRRLRAGKTLLQAPAPLNWFNLTESTTKTPLSGYFIPGLTVAHDEWDAANQPAAQIPCYVAVIAIESTPPPTVQSQRLLAAQLDSAETSFEKLAKMALRWAIAAQHGAPISPEGVDASIITADALQILIDFQLNSKDADPTPIPADAASEFMRRQFEFTLKLPTSENVNTSFFPMPAELTLAVDAWGADQPLSYQFKNYNQLSDAMLAYLRKYFDELAVKVQQEQGAPPVLAQALGTKSLSMAEWIISDYFLLIVRQMVQAARDALRQFKVPLAAGDTPNKIAGWLKTTGDLEDYTLFELFAANPTHPLNASKRLLIGVHSFASAQAGMLSFNTLARDAKQNVGAFTAQALALANAASVLILQAGTVVRYVKPDGTVVSHTIVDGNSALDVAKAFKVTFADLLINSDFVSVNALRDGAQLLLPYATCRVLAGETFNSIAGNAVYQGGFTGAALALGNAAQPILRTAAKVVITATGREYFTRANDTLADVANNLDLTLAQLFEQTTVLTDAALLAPVAVLQLPAFGINTAAGETLEQIIERFAISMDVLTLTPANGEQVDLFLSDAQNLTLDAPHLPQFRVDELIKEIQRGVVLQQLSGMASRYYLHGLRLPTKQSAELSVQPLAKGMWVREVDSKLVLPDRAGLYALTGQQFKVPVLPDVADTPPFIFRLQRTAGPAWLLFSGGQQELSISIAYDSPDAKRIRKVTEAARAGATAISLSKLGRGVMLQSEPVRYAFASSLLWQSAAPVRLPYGEAGPNGLPSLRIWRMPDAMVNLARPAIFGSPEAGLLPRFAIKIARYDEATGATVTNSVRSHGWATTIEFTVKRVPATDTSVSSNTTYELVGAAGNSVQLLERIIEQVQGNNAAFQTIYLGFAPEQTGPASEGVQTDAPAGLTFGIAQVNLSTITRPPTTAFGLLAEAKQAGLGMLNSPAEFLQLLWTASISRAGGFYLYYFDAEENRGLPERLFNDRNEAALVLTVIYSAPAEAPAQNRVTDYMNAVAVGETVETGNSVVFAESNPTKFSLDSDNIGSLDAIALKYYADAAKIAVANEQRALATGSKVIVTEGLYQPPPGPGVPLSTIQSNFSVSLALLNAANPRYNGTLPDPVVFPVTLNLPRIEVIVGTSPASGSFTAIAAYYGQAVASIASYAENRAAAPIFAPSQKIEVTSGPIANSSTVPPGVQALLALRDAPPPVPVSPDAAGYADIFLANNFSLLSYTVAANPYFRTSNLGLPAGPTSKPAVETFDKLLIPAPVADVTEWNYQQSVPYSQFAIVPSLQAALFLPPASGNPYRGVSDLLQIQFDWQDLYGNTLVTGLTSPTAGNPPYNQPPMRLGYTDALIGLSQWPSIASSYQVDASSGSAQVQLFLSFDASRYEGVLSAKIPSTGSILVTFTQDVDKVTAETAANYAIEGQSITAATLMDARTVRLTADLPLDRLFALVVNQVDSADLKQQFSGQASFIGDQAISSSLTLGATNALRTYQQLYYQFNDPFGVEFSVETSLLQKPIVLTAAQVTAVRNWLFYGDAGKTSIYQFLNDRAAGNTTVAPPPSSCNLQLPIATGQLNSGEIFLLNLSFIVRRTGGSVLDELANTPGITRSETVVSPQLKQVSGGPDNPTLGLAQFAALFQSALSTPGQIRWKIATGVDRRSVTSARNGSALWVVRLGIQQEPQLPISYTIPSAGKPVIFAPRPISNELQSHSGVEITTYVTGQGLKGPKVRIDFSNIDMDTWGRQFFASVDGVLTPEFTSATQIVGTLQSKNYLKDLLAQKELLASIAKLWMIPAYPSGSGADASNVQEAYYQQMLTTLASAYTTRAALEYSAKVRAQVDEPGYPITPRLFGAIDLATPRILSAVSTPDTPTIVLVNFSSPMDVAQATTPANYTFTPSIGILTVHLSDDAKTATLQLSAEVQLNSTMVTVSTAVKDKLGRTLHPPLSWVIRQPNDARDVAREITFSSPKLDLKDTDAAPIPFLVIAPENVRGGSGEIVATLELDLVYRGSDIEHQISRPEGVKGYVASSWLSFVIRDEDWPLERNLGVARIPMPLRSFPTAPAMIDQTPIVDPEAPNLSNLTRWSYTFSFSLPVHYPQDRVLSSVEFNLGNTPNLLAKAGLEGAFNELAQFITTFPQVSQDLIKFLGAVDSQTEAGSENAVNAGVALASTIEMLRAITNKATKEGGLLMPASRRLGLGDPNLRYSFYIEECSIVEDGSPRNGALLVTLVGARPVGVGMPWVHVGDAAYKAERYLGNDCAGAACDNQNRFCFLYKNDASKYLTAEEGQLIPARIVELPELDLFQRQNAQAVASIKRNVGLAEPFVYTTSDVSFTNPLQPTVDSSRAYDIAALGATLTTKRSLFEQLKNLFDNLLKNNQQPTITLQVEINYAYILNTSLPPVPLPLLMQPATAVRVSGTGPEPTLDQVLTAWSDGIRHWFETTLPLGTLGKLHFNLTLMTNLVQPSMPLLWTRNLELALASIDPPLPTR